VHKWITTTLYAHFFELSAKQRGAVLFYREESVQHQSHTNALRVIHKIEELRLTDGLSEKDFE